MNPFILSPSQRIIVWEEFRDSLPNLSEEKQLIAVAEFWAQCPFASWTIDSTQPKTWKSIWEMLFAGSYCINSVAVCIETTLRLSGWDASRLKLLMISENISKRSEYFVVQIDDNHILNYSYGYTIPVTEINNKFDIPYIYQWINNKYTKII